VCEPQVKAQIRKRVKNVGKWHEQVWQEILQMDSSSQALDTILNLRNVDDIGLKQKAMVQNKRLEENRRQDAHVDAEAENDDHDQGGDHEGPRDPKFASSGPFTQHAILLLYAEELHFRIEILVIQALHGFKIASHERFCHALFSNKSDTGITTGDCK